VKLRVGLFLVLTLAALGVGVVIRDYVLRQTKGQIGLDRDLVEVPFDNHGGHLYVRGSVNGTSVQDLIVDSGAADVFISESNVKKLQLKRQGNVLIPGGTSGIATAYVPNLAWQLGTLTLRDRQSVVIPQAEVAGLEQYFGRRLDGILGYELFEQLVVELDYQRHRLRFHRPQTYQYRGSGQSVPLLIEGDRPYIEAKVLPYGYSSLTGKFLIDLGSNGALSVTAGCGLDRQLMAAAPGLLQRQVTTIHGETQIVLGRVQQIQIGALKLAKPLTIFGANAAGECDRVAGKIGNQILQQFKVTLDYPHRQMMLEPVVAQPYEYDLSGLRFQAKGRDFKIYRIEAVFPQTPAAKAQLKVGDIVTQVNGKSAAQLTLPQIRAQLSEPNRTPEIEIQRGSQRFQVRLPLKPLI
jgi:hypothetical protein